MLIPLKRVLPLLRLYPELNVDSGSPWEQRHPQTIFPLELHLWNPAAHPYFPTNSPNHVVFFSLSLSNCRICLTRAMRIKDVRWLFMDFTFYYCWCVSHLDVFDLCITPNPNPNPNPTNLPMSSSNTNPLLKTTFKFVFRFFFIRFYFFLGKEERLDCKTHFCLFVLTLMHL